MSHANDFTSHFAASTVAAVINFPLWRASAIAQSGFKLEGKNFLARYYQAAVKPPFKGLSATIAGMAWARGAIFCKIWISHRVSVAYQFRVPLWIHCMRQLLNLEKLHHHKRIMPFYVDASFNMCPSSWIQLLVKDGSEHGKVALMQLGFYGPLAQMLPPLVIGTLVQCINMPLVRATITIQNPTCELKTVGGALHHIYTTRGIEGTLHRANRFLTFLLLECSELIITEKCVPWITRFATVQADLQNSSTDRSHKIKQWYSLSNQLYPLLPLFND